MPSVTKQDLHLAKSFEELRKKCENSPTQMQKFDSYDVERLVFTSKKLYDKALEDLKKGDDEVAYMMFFRFMSLLNSIKKEKQTKLYKRVKDIADKTMERLEELAKELPLRYAERQKSYENRKAQLFDQSKTSIPGTSIKIDIKKSALLTEDDDNDEYRTVSSADLVQSLQTLSEINKILIIDIRSAEEFNESSIAANKMPVTGEVNLINIPRDSINPGLTFSKLRKQLSFGVALDALERRRSMDRVVIIDATTTHFDKSSPSVILADALTKWDSESPDRIKAKPLLLKGGYADFVITFGPFTTNANIIHKYSEVNVQDRFDINNLANKYCYEFDEDKPQQTVTQNTAKSSNILPDIDKFILNNNGKINNSKGSLFQNRINQFSNNLNDFKVPGVAVPVIPDRSTKPVAFSDILAPNSSNIDIKNNGDKMTNEVKEPKVDQPKTIDQSSFNGKDNNLSKNISEMREALPPKPVHLLSSLNNHNKILNGYVDQGDNRGKHGKKSSNIEDDLSISGKSDEQKLSLNNATVASSNLEQIFDFDEDMEVEQENYENSPPVSPPIAEGHRNGTSSPLSSSLSRSLSSPNIAQLEQDYSHYSVGSGTSKFTPPRPIVDRTLKPLFHGVQLKARDFSPQFSSLARIAGLRNMGNTCFMNAILQCLNNTYQLSKYLLGSNVHINLTSKFGSNGELAIELMELIKQMVYPSNYKHISPRDLKAAVIRHIPDFVEFKQQDAHEFLVRFLDRVHADLNPNESVSNSDDPIIKDPNYYDKLTMAEAATIFWERHSNLNKSIISKLFEGLIVNTLKCVDCDYSSKTLEPFTCLSLPIPNESRTSLKKCLNLYLRGERITDEAAWQCQQCKQKRDADKCSFIWKLPNVLIIHLKRFSYDGMWRQKIYTMVDFPLENMQIQSEKGELKNYNLYGVVNHAGSLEGGHYIAFSRNLNLNIDWHRYDDQEVSPIPANEVITQNAYVLFYKLSSL